MLQTFLPYVVVAAVVALFFAFCCLILLKNSDKEIESAHGRQRHRTNHYNEAEHEDSVRKEYEAELKESAKEALASQSQDADKTISLEKTQVFPKHKIRTAHSTVDDNEKTRLFTKEEFTSVQDEEHPAMEDTESFRGPGFRMEPEPEIHDSITDPAELEEYFVRHFLNRYGSVTRTVAQDARTVTHYLISNLPVTSPREACDTLNHIMVQEALQNAQRTYVMMPDDIVLGMVKDAFNDVAMGSRSETRTILAYDSLKAMPRMEMTHFRSLALLLLFHYSRNTGNVNARALREYTQKYITPFISMPLPDEYSGYQQLEYLYCISLENKEVPFGQILRDSYPLVFSFRGCMKSELTSVYPHWRPGMLTESLYNSYYKLAVVDDSMLSRYFDEYEIDDYATRSKLTALMHSRPVTYDRQEMHHTLERIDKDLAVMQDIWDSSMLRKSSLTLMGMYIARIYIREAIGEDFDLSHWM